MKRMICALLSVMMLALPLCGLAEGIDKATVAFSVKRTLLSMLLSEKGTAVADLLDALRIEAAKDDTGALLSVRMNGEEAVSLGLAAQDDLICITGSVMSAPVAATREEALALAGWGIAQLSKGRYSEEQATAVVQQAANGISLLMEHRDMIAGLVGAGAATATAATATAAAVSPALLTEQVMSGFDADLLQQWNALLTEVSAEAATEAYAGDEMPTATRSTTVTLSPEKTAEIVRLGAALLKSNDMLMSALNTAAQQLGLGGTAGELLDELAARVENAAIPETVVTVYTTDNGTVAGAKLVLTEENDVKSATFTTLAEGESYRLTAEENGQNLMTADAELSTIGTATGVSVTLFTGETERGSLSCMVDPESGIYTAAVSNTKTTLAAEYAALKDGSFEAGLDVITDETTVSVNVECDVPAGVLTISLLKDDDIVGTVELNTTDTGCHGSLSVLGGEMGTLDLVVKDNGAELTMAVFGMEVAGMTVETTHESGSLNLNLANPVRLAEMSGEERTAYLNGTMKQDLDNALTRFNSMLPASVQALTE